MKDIVEIDSLIPMELLEPQDIGIETVVDNVSSMESRKLPSETLMLQLQVEKKCAMKLLKQNLQLKDHLAFLQDPVDNGLAGYFVVLDASKPWIIYWILNSLSILDHSLSKDLKSRAVNALKICLNEDGGFGGGLGQITHLATTYAAINAIAIIDTIEAYALINKSKLANLFASLKLPDGSFRVHHGGEVDIRATYCVFSCCKLIGLEIEELSRNCANFVSKCQSWDGGIGPFPGVEAHGGYTYCGLAALVLLNETKLIDLDRLCFWLVHRQMKIEGGFSGRTNKLVDGCYSYWIGTSLTIIQALMNTGYLYSAEKLQQYILKCCQCKDGGLRDKPGKY